MKENVYIRSDEVREIMEKTPIWIIRWGITLILIIILLIIAGSYFFSYPTIIHSKIIVTTENPPASIKARTSGRIQDIFVEDKQIVSPGDILAIIENPAEYSDVVLLKSKLSFVKDFFYYYDPEMVSVFNTNLKLGELQYSYSTYLKSLNDYRNFLQLDYHDKKIKSLNQELALYKDYYRRLSKQLGLLKDKLALREKQFSRDSILFMQNVISNAEFEQSKSALFKELSEIEAAELNLSSTEIDMANTQKNILELELEKTEQLKQQKLELLKEYENLSAEVSKWELNYLLKSPVEGQVTFTKIWSENQFIKENETVFTIIPQNPGKIIGKIHLPIKGSGKVKTGQKVNIKFDNYPYLEYGIVKGVVKNISMVPEDSNYFVEVYLPEGLKTFYNKELKFTQEMQGEAEIMTDELSLFMRIVNPLKYIFEKNLKGAVVSN